MFGECLDVLGSWSEVNDSFDVICENLGVVGIEFEDILY